MMLRHLTTSGFVLSLALMPMSAYAYITPDQALDESGMTTNFYAPPPTIRSIPDVIKQQQLNSELQRQAGLNAVLPKSSSSSSEALHDAAPDQNQTELDKMIELMKLMQNGQSSSVTSDPTHSNLDPVTQRLLIRIQAQQAEAERAALIQSITGQDGTLHSGAPLTQSGPASVVVMLAVAAAIAETWRRVRKTEKAVL